MAHNISERNGKAQMAYTGEQPWHGLGTRVDGLQTAESILVAAGLDWTVSTRPMFHGTVPNRLQDVPDHVAIVRDGDDTVFGVASKRYQIVQNAQVGDLGQALMNEGACFEVAGALGNGSKLWLLAKLPGEFEVIKGDMVKPYFLLAWGHDGKHGIAGKLTPVRVVCQNTLAAAGFGKGKWSRSADIYIRHYGNPTVNLSSAREALGLVMTQAERTRDAYQAMAQYRITSGHVAEYIHNVFPEPEVPTGTSDLTAIEAALMRYEKWETLTDEVIGLANHGRGADMARGTLWGAYNAVTEYVDHVYPVLSTGKVSAARQESALFGTYAEVKTRALDTALAMVG